MNTGIYTRTYTYRDVSDTQTTTQIASVTYSGLTDSPSDNLTYSYTYDAVGNIATYTAPDGEVITYTYDDQGQLLSAVGDQTYTYTYDNVGNMLTGFGRTFTYGDSTWGDLLTAVNGVTISYDEIGNPLTWYNGSNWILSWENGRQLKEIKHISGSRKTVFTYDADGLRLRKISDGITHDYTYAGGKLMREVITRSASGTVEVWDFFYDEAGRPFAVQVDGVMYYYITNLQGDVMQIVDSNGTTVATYDYDPYGNIAWINGNLAYTNPIRYRGYYFDTEVSNQYLLILM